MPEGADRDRRAGVRVAFLGNAHVHARDYALACLDDPRATIVGAACLEPTPYDFPPGVPRFGSATDLPTHELCVIASDIASHVRLADAVRAPHVFVEKPLGTDEATARRAAERLSGTGAAFRTGFFLRHGAPVRRLRAELAGGAIGALREVDLAYAHPGLTEGWLRDWPAHLDVRRMGYGVFGDLAAHLVDLAAWCLGPLEAERCRLTVADGVDVAGTAELRARGGVPVRLSTGALAERRTLALRFAGEGGALAVLDDALVLDRPGVGRRTLESPADLTPRAGFARELDAVRADRPSDGATLDDAIAVNAALDGLYACAERVEAVAAGR